MVTNTVIPSDPADADHLSYSGKLASTPQGLPPDPSDVDHPNYSRTISSSVTDPNLKSLLESKNPVVGTLAGFGQGLAQTNAGVGTILHKLLGTRPDPKTVEQFNAAENVTGPGKGTGKFLEGLGEFMGGARLSGASSIAKLLPRALAMGGVGGTQAAVKSGGDPTETTIGTLAGGLGEGALSPAIKALITPGAGKLALKAGGTILSGALMQHALGGIVGGPGSVMGGIGVAGAAMAKLMAKKATRDVVTNIIKGGPLGMSDSAAAHLIKDALVGTTVQVLGPNDIREDRVVQADGSLK